MLLTEHKPLPFNYLPTSAFTVPSPFTNKLGTLSASFIIPKEVLDEGDEDLKIQVGATISHNNTIRLTPPTDMPSYILYGKTITLSLTNEVKVGRGEETEPYPNTHQTLNVAIRTLINLNLKTRKAFDGVSDWVKAYGTVRVACGPYTGVDEFVRGYILDKPDLNFTIFTRSRAYFFPIDHRRICQLPEHTIQGDWWGAVKTLGKVKADMVIVTDATYFENFDDGFRELYAAIGNADTTVLLLG